MPAGDEVGMTKIEAVIRPSRLEPLKQALSAWVTGLTVTEVTGCGRQRGHTELYRGAEYVVDLLPKLKVEVVVPTPLVPRVLDVIERCVRTPKLGDGKVFVTPVDEAVRVRTGERGEGAL
jgi:nitrogen regulatory protein P-II 1